MTTLSQALKKDPLEIVNLEGIDPALLASVPLTSVQLDALVVIKIIKHCKDYYPITATGQLLGIDVAGILEVTNCFPFTSKPDEDSESHPDELDGAEYQLQMLRSLRKLNFDANTIGWYQSTHLGSFWNQSLIETQYNYQKAFSQSVVIVYDPARSAQGNLCLRALRLTDTFMDLYRDKKFTMDNLRQRQLTPSTVFQSLPITIKNSHLLSALLHQLEENSSIYSAAEASLSVPSSNFSSRFPSDINPWSTNYDNLELSLESYLEKHIEYLGDTIEEHGQEQWKWHGWQRSLVREQQRLSQLSSKRKAENSARISAGLTPTYTDEEVNNPSSPNLTKLLANEPSRLETLIIANQIDTYCKQINQFAGPGITKMYMAKAVQQ